MQPSLTELSSYPLRGDTQARSVLLVTLQGTPYVLAGLADGHLVSFPLVGGPSVTLGDPKKVRFANSFPFACSCPLKVVIRGVAGVLGYTAGHTFTLSL